MLKTSYTFAATVLKASAISALLAGAAFAQSTTVTTETTVPADAVPLAHQGMSDVQITDFLTAQGLQDIAIERKDDHITATGTRDGNTVTLVYNEKDGKLLTYDGNAPDEAAHAAFLSLGDAKMD